MKRHIFVDVYKRQVRASASSVDDPRLLEVDVITGLDDPEVVEKEELVTTVSLLG